MAALPLLLNKVSLIAITKPRNFPNSFMLRLMGRCIDLLCDSERLSLFHMDGFKQLFFSSWMFSFFLLSLLLWLMGTVFAGNWFLNHWSMCVCVCVCVWVCMYVNICI